jgi:hypothetical protein
MLRSIVARVVAGRVMLGWREIHTLPHLPHLEDLETVKDEVRPSHSHKQTDGSSKLPKTVDWRCCYWEAWHNHSTDSSFLG